MVNHREMLRQNPSRITWCTLPLSPIEIDPMLVSMETDHYLKPTLESEACFVHCCSRRLKQQSYA